MEQELKVGKNKINIIIMSIIIISTIGILALLLTIDSTKVISTKDYAEINGTKIELEYAKSAKEKSQGLSDREELCLNCGLLFVYDDYENLAFWMKDMNFTLDIIWIKDEEIIKISKDLAPEGEKPEKIYKSEEPVNYVLEVNGGFCDKYGIKKGDEVKYIKNLKTVTEKK